MKKIVIDKEFVKGYESLFIVFENCDVYEINVADILDISCEAALINEKGREYRTDDGFIKIAANTAKTAESSVLRDQALGMEQDYRLKERLEMCGGCADMTSFSLKDKETGEFHIYVPYDPLERVVTGGEIELSNCPSLEFDNEGNMIIAFGKSSQQPKRKDNNYSELIAGWEEAFGQYEPTVLKAKVKGLSTFGENTNFSFLFKICDKKCKNNLSEFLFMNCQNVDMEMAFPNKGVCKMFMSKMADGRIYVGFGGLGIEFTCSSVLEYDYYCNKSEEIIYN